MKLDEILNRKVDYEVVKQDEKTFHTKAKIGDRVIHFLAEPNSGDGAWHVLFFQTTVDNKSMTFNATGDRGEMEVFSMVKDSMMDFVEKYKPAEIEFTSEKGTNARSQLYDRLVKRFKLPGYEYSKETKGRDDYFTLVRTDQTQK